MMGDNNLPHANWTTGQCSTGATTDVQEMVPALYNFKNRICLSSAIRPPNTYFEMNQVSTKTWPQIGPIRATI